MTLCISFGTTETGSVTITPFEAEEDRIFETVGKALEGNEVKIVNERRETLPPGEIGEIACRGFGVMKGYYNMPEQTAEVLDEDGWYYTGDLGMMDEYGYIRFIGRKKELIIRGGYNIYPKEIETILQQHPVVFASAVVGLPDPVLGESVCAVIQPKEGVHITEADIIEFLRPLVADYKLPNKVVFVDQFPTTGSGKIQKGKLKEMLKEY
ncbi:AMP-binding protein [Geobacillus sp. G4]